MQKKNDSSFEYTQDMKNTGHIERLNFNASVVLANKEKEFLKGNSKKQIKRHCHLTGYLHAQRPLGVRQHEKCTGVIEIWLVIY